MDYSEIIIDVMQDEVAYPTEIPERTSRQGVRGYAEMNCSGCAWSWSTHRAHVVINLRSQSVDKIWKQKCKRCDTERTPSFREIEFRKLVVKAIEQEKKFRNRTIGDDNDFDDDDDGQGRRGKPHESRLCEKCEYGRKQCWIRRK